MLRQISKRIMHGAPICVLLVFSLPVIADNGSKIVGSWYGTAIAAGGVRPPVTDMSTFASDGTIVESQRLYLNDTPFGPVIRTPGHGAWKKVGDNKYAATIRVIYQGAENHPSQSGEIIATETARFELKLDQTGNRLSGYIYDELRDPSGNILFSGYGDMDYARILAELPPPRP